MALLNGTSYSWGQLLIKLSSMDSHFVGITACNYSRNQEKENLYGVGNLPVGRGYGNINLEGSITLVTEEFRKLLDSSPNGQIGDRNREDLIVTYMHPIENRIVTDIIQDIDFTDIPTDLTQNDKQFEHELPFICSDIRYDVRA